MEKEKYVIDILYNKLDKEYFDIADTNAKFDNLFENSFRASNRLKVSSNRLIGYFKEGNIDYECFNANENLETCNRLFEEIKKIQNRRKLHKENWALTNAEMKNLTDENKKNNNVVINEGRREKIYLRNYSLK